jgi:hypothetical protein|tara:strand:+ start:198 stop:377 length:180 start_codon:yes stop_codon:yes gene_type:complete
MNKTYWIYEAPPIEKQSSKTLLLTQSGICILGPWNNTIGVIAWHPLPSRNRDEEKKCLS